MHDKHTTERHLLHFRTYPSAAGDHAPLLYAGMKSYPVQAHSRATLAEARVGNPLLQQLPDTQFSHYIEVDLPADEVMMTQLVRPIEVDGVLTEQFLALAVHLPRETRRRCAHDAGLLRADAEPHPKLEWLLGQADWAQTARALSQLRAGDLEADFLHDLIDPFETASALLAQHPGLINLGAQDGAPVYILRDCIGRALRRRSRLVSEIENLGDRWSRRIPLLDDGEPVVDEDGPVFAVELHERVRRLMTEPLSAALRFAHQLERLRNQTWRVQYGATTDERDAVQAAVDAAERPSVRADETRWTLKALTRMNGLRTNPDVAFDPPRAGGWTINQLWSSDHNPPMSPDIVAALGAGRLFARVDSVDQQGVWVGAFAAQALRDDEQTQFEARHERDTAGADYARVSLSLNALHRDLSVSLVLTTTTSSEALAGVSLGVREADGAERIVWSARSGTRSEYGNLRIRVTNEWLRFLGAYVEFHDAAGNAIEPPEWNSRLPGAVASLFDRHPTRRYLDLLSPIDTVFGIPLRAQTTVLNIPVPVSAASVKIYWGGLGTGAFDATVCPCGITCTAVLNLALPVILLMSGSSEKDGGFVNNLMRDPQVRYGVFGVGALLVTTGSGTYIGLSQDPGRAARAVAIKIGPMLLKGLVKELAIYLARKIGEGFAKRAIPLINFAFAALDAAVNLALLGQTTAAILQSPFYYATRLTRTFDLRVTIRPDQRFNRFPDLADTLRVQVAYDAGNALPLSETKLSGTSRSAPIPVQFDAIAAGGHIKVFVFFYAENGWQAASGATAWMAARGRDGSAVLDVEVFVTDELIPLSRESVYQHRHALAYEGGRYQWKRGAAPTATIGDSSGLVSLAGITVAQRPMMLAYAWQASGLNLPADRPGQPVQTPLHALQTISLDDPQLQRATAPVGFTLRSGVAYDLGSPEDGSGANFYLDPSAGPFDVDRNVTGGFHLRRIALARGATPRFDPGSAQSWGRFPSAVDSFVVHPQGYVAGVSSSESKLYLLELPAAPSDNTHAPMASPYSGHSGDDATGSARAGLLARPTAIAVALDGRLLVLEDGNRRIQSFDLSGNPVPYFRQPGTAEKSPLLPLRETAASATRYLDLSVEARGYLFVLARDGSGARPDDYRVDIYEPDGSFLVSTPRVAAAKIAVDLARSLYTLNWETWTGADGRTEPSVSLWLAPPPAAGEDA